MKVGIVLTQVLDHTLSSRFSFAGKPGHIPPRLSLWADVELINKACCGLEVSLSLGSWEPPSHTKAQDSFQF